MGKTAYSGPVYGAKQTLASLRVQDISTGGGDGLAGVVLSGLLVPSGEDWYATDFSVFRGSTGSTGMGFAVLDDSTLVSSVTINSSVANASSGVIVTADPGEYEGKRIAAGSVVTFTVTQSSGVAASSAVTLCLSGFRRFVSSTRAE
jgi:hypothetical protein